MFISRRMTFPFTFEFGLGFALHFDTTNLLSPLKRINYMSIESNKTTSDSNQLKRIKLHFFSTCRNQHRELFFIVMSIEQSKTYQWNFYQKNSVNKLRKLQSLQKTIYSTDIWVVLYYVWHYNRMAQYQFHVLPSSISKGCIYFWIKSFI